MVQYRNVTCPQCGYLLEPNHIGNFFDRVLEGVGLRGSSFSNLDDINAITHDKGPPAHRYLVQEFKHEGERTRGGQMLMLRALATEERFTVFHVTLHEDQQRVYWIDLLYPETRKLITLADYRDRVDQWWHERYNVGIYLEAPTREIQLRARRFRY